MGYIDEHRSRSSRNLLATGLVITLGTAGVFALTRDYYRNFVRGPFAIDEAGLAALPSAEATKDRFVTVTGSDAIDTGVQQVSETRDKYTNKLKSSEVTGKFVALRVGKRLLLVNAPPDHAGNEYRGELVPISLDMKQQVIDPIVKEEPAVEAMFLPVALDAASSYRTGGWVGLAFGVPLLLLGVTCVSRAAQRIGDPSLHPLTKALALLGPAEDLARGIDAEVAAPEAVRLGPTLLTRSWIFRPFWYGVHFARLDDVVWAYGHVTQHKTNGIKTHRTIEARLHDRRGKQLTILVKNDDALGEVLTQLAARAPWIIVGHDEKIAALWAKDKSLVVAASDARKKNPGTGAVEIGG